jgi:hypothetical protein
MASFGDKAWELDIKTVEVNPHSRYQVKHKEKASLIDCQVFEHPDRRRTFLSDASRKRGKHSAEVAITK